MNSDMGNAVALRQDAGSNPAPAAMTFTFCHPSYKRPTQARQCYDAWDDGGKMQWVVSLNYNDPTAHDYMIAFNGADAMVIQSPTSNMVMASNAAAKQATGDILILVSDDMWPTADWRHALTMAFRALDGPVVLQLHDGIRDDIMTFPVMNRAAYELLGYLYHPSYISMFADNDLAETAKALGIYHRCDARIVEHRHYTTGKAANDATYQHENSRLAWQHGKYVFDMRAKQGFR